MPIRTHDDHVRGNVDSMLPKRICHRMLGAGKPDDGRLGAVTRQVSRNVGARLRTVCAKRSFWIDQRHIDIGSLNQQIDRLMSSPGRLDARIPGQ